MTKRLSNVTRDRFDSVIILLRTPASTVTRRRSMASQQAQGEFLQEEKPQVTDDEIGDEIQERHSLHALVKQVGARSTSSRATAAAKQRAPSLRAAPGT